jgi:hypothetical protein
MLQYTELKWAHLLIDDLFNDTTIISNYIVSNGRMINERMERMWNEVVVA